AESLAAENSKRLRAILRGVFQFEQQRLGSADSARDRPLETDAQRRTLNAQPTPNAPSVGTSAPSTSSTSHVINQLTSATDSTGHLTRNLASKVSGNRIAAYSVT